MIFANKIDDSLPMNTPFMIKKEDKIENAIYIKTQIGIIGVDVETIEQCGYNAANIFMIPAGTDDVCDMASVRVDGDATINSPLSARLYGDIYSEDPTVAVEIDRESIKEAFIIDG